jgi:ribonuclease R
VKQKREHGFPARDAIVAFIRAHPGKVGTREIAREFGLKNADRAELKRILRELADEGTVAKRGRKIQEPAGLPPTVMADITGRDTDGELIAIPTEWDAEENGPAPQIRIHVPRRPQPGTVAGVGDRALLRIETADESKGPPYHGRVIKIVDHARARLLGIFRALPEGGGRLVPVDKKQAGRELNIAKADANGAEDGDLVSVDLIRSRGFGLASGRVKERLGSLASEKAISLIAIHAHEIPQAFSPSALREAEEAKPATLQGREDWRDVPLVTIDPPDAKDHDDAVHAEADPDPNNKGGYIVNVAIADVAFYVRPGSALDRDALQRGNSVYFPDRVVPMLPDNHDHEIGRQVVGTVRREIEPANRAMVVDLQEHAKQPAFAAPRAAAEKTALHRGPQIAFFGSSNLARPDCRRRAYRFHDLPRFDLPGFALPGLRSFLRGLRPGCALALRSARGPSRFLPRGMT